MSKPLISVIMSVYNARTFVESAIRSILNQTCREFEFLITDDGSTDGSAGLIDEFAASDDRIRVFRQANTGLTVALNQMIAVSRGDFVARMDADDVSHPSRFEKQCQYLAKNPECGIVGTGSLNIDEQGRPTGGYVVPDDHDFLAGSLERGVNHFRHGCIMARKSLLMALDGPYRFRYGQDFDLLLRLSERTRLGMVQEVLYLYRQHGGAIQGAMGPFRAKQRAVMLELHRIRKEGLKEPPWQGYDQALHPTGLDLSKGNQAQSLFVRGVAAFRVGSMAEARRCFLGTLCHREYRLRSLVYWSLALLPSGFGRWLKAKEEVLRDELRHYRVPNEEWTDIVKACRCER